MIRRLLRRFKVLSEHRKVVQNRDKLKLRQNQQLSLLEPLKNNVDKSLLNAKVEDLVNINDEKVFNTFATRCLQPQIRSLNGLADVNIERVFEKQAHKKVPFTVKDHLKVDGMITTCGFTDNLKPAQTTSDVVQYLQEQGCIAYAHSNVPLGLLGIQAENGPYGLSKNPHNPAFVSGGSSGGEGTLVASKACSFGVGSDSGGSVRIPAAFCGTYAFKPTGSKRLSVKGRVNPRGLQGIKIGDVDPCFGYLTRHVDDLSWLCSKTIGKSTPDYPFMYGGEWDEIRYEAAKRKKLTVGYIYQNYEMKVASGLVNTIKQTLSALQGDKHTVVKFDFPKLHQMRDFFFQFIHQSGFMNGMVERMQGHHPTRQIADLYDIFHFGKMGTQLKRQKIRDPLVKQLYSHYMRARTTEQFFRIHREADELKKEFLKEWREKGIDVLVSPVLPFTALLPGAADLLIYQLGYCSYQNVLELPAGVIPTRRVKAQETIYQPTNAFERKAAPSIHASKGLPLSIQVTGKHLADQECLAAMWTINRLVGNCLEPSFGKY